MERLKSGIVQQNKKLELNYITLSLKLFILCLLPRFFHRIETALARYPAKLVSFTGKE